MAGSAGPARTGARRCAGSGTGALGVGSPGDASEGALDDLVAAGDAVEAVAWGGDVAAGLDVKSTTDLGKRGEFDAGGC